MLSQCQKEEEYNKAFDAKGKYNSAESLWWLWYISAAKND